MNWLDLVFLGIVAISVIISLMRGFVRECISVVIWIVAVWAGLRFAEPLAGLLEAWVASPTVRLVLAFALLFIGVLLAGAVVNYLAGLLVGKTGLTGTDRILGVVFGGLRGGLIVALLVLLAGLTSVPQERWWQDSAVAATVTPWVCTVGVGEWLEGLELYQPVVTDDGVAEGQAAEDYWRAFCRDQGAHG